MSYYISIADIYGWRGEDGQGGQRRELRDDRGQCGGVLAGAGTLHQNLSKVAAQVLAARSLLPSGDDHQTGQRGHNPNPQVRRRTHHPAGKHQSRLAEILL